ncbi:hypothetical protein MUK42_26945 [Musa troglodytarum]|uniref:Uncharacterized protein n=1 Tax=Musa troglodytarum TaxID=320322 RepID=A0A9E7K2T4_9LILI|nr:hypothetical protein MUK42_26945 [Musa troglodytarum]
MLKRDEALDDTSKLELQLGVINLLIESDVKWIVNILNKKKPFFGSYLIPFGRLFALLNLFVD